MAMENRVEDGPSSRFFNWAWQIQGNNNNNNNITPMPVFPIAASSGFSSSSTTISPTATSPLNTQTNFVHNLYLPTPTTSVTDNSLSYNLRS